MILVHEFGHFITAKLSGVKVNEFALGMGPKLISVMKGETRYSLRLLPLGGFCAMEGEDENSEDERSFNKATWLRRFLILIAGAFMNLLLGFLIIVILFSSFKTLPDPTFTTFADEHLNNEAFLLKPGDQALKINGENIYVSSDIVTLLDRYAGSPYTFTVRRDGKVLTLDNIEINRGTYILEGESFTGFGLKMNVVEATPLGILKYSYMQSVDLVRMIRMSLTDLFAGQLSVNDMSGPVGISAAITETAQESAASMWFLVAFITINLGVMNLLPLPALDGGRLVFLLIELIRRKPMNPKYEGYVHAAGLVAFMLLAVFITYNDIARLISGA